MDNKDVVEFYLKDGLVCSVRSSMVPLVGNKLSVRKKIYEVISVTYAIDYADDLSQKRMRANVDVKLINTTHKG